MNNNQNTRKTVSEADINLLHKADEIHNQDVKNLVLIHQVYDTGYLQRQLAEECSELAQAALKLIRVWNKETPIAEETVLASYLEELADVWVMLSTALQELDDSEMQTCANIADYKRDRLHTRLCEAAVQGRGDYAKTLEDDVVCPRERPSGCQKCYVKPDEPGEDDVWDDLDAAWADMDEALTQITAEHMEQKQLKVAEQQENVCKRCRQGCKADKDDWQEVMDFVRKAVNADRAVADKLRQVFERE